jgi:ABC-type Na+ efflux pump permease subunit
MLTTFAIAQNDLARYAKNRMAIFWTFLGPAVCMWFFGFLTPPSSGLVPVTVVHRDAQSKTSDLLIASLRRDGHFVTESSEIPRSGLSIEVGTAGSASSVPAITLHTGDHEDEAERSLRFEVEAAVAPSVEQSQVILSLPPAAKQITGGFQRTVPAYLIMFLTMNLLMSGATFAEERASGRMRRLLTAPIPALSIVLGRLGSRLIVAWLQMLLLFSIGVFVLRIQWASHPLSLVLVLSLYVFAMGSIGVLIGALFKDPDHAAAFAMWCALILAPLTGLWWPIELMPAPLQLLGQLLPTGWVMQSVNSMLSAGSGIGDFPWTVFGLILVAGLAIWLSTRRLARPAARQAH